MCETAQNSTETPSRSTETARDSTDQPPSSRSVLEVELPIQSSQPPVAKLALDKNSPLNRFERIRQLASQSISQSVSQSDTKADTEAGRQSARQQDRQPDRCLNSQEGGAPVEEELPEEHQDVNCPHHN